MAVKPKILVCPLNWGIGHASRMVPVINELLEQGAEVYIGASGGPLEFLKLEFPGLPCIDIPGYNVVYSKSAYGMAMKIAMQFPSLYRWIRREHDLLNQIINEYGINGVISDNRYGLWSNQIPCIFITHQVFIQTPWYLKFLAPVIYRLNRNFILKFRECWIPDYNDERNLSGKLSHKKTLARHFHFIGPLSRFAGIKATDQEKEPGQFKYDVLAILSGPEPQRSLLEKQLLSDIASLKIKAAVVLGKPGSKPPQKEIDNCAIYPHLETESLLSLIKASRLIIARSGYSSVMDLAATGKKAVLIPTPGQTEQEYLGKYLHSKNYFFSVSQKDFNLSYALDKVDSYPGIHFHFDKSMLKERIAYFLQMNETGSNSEKREI